MRREPLIGVARCACGERLGVVDSREQDTGTIRRRRACTACGQRYSTVEIGLGEYRELKRDAELLRRIRENA